MYRCFSACLTPCDVLTVKSRAERIETPLLILTAGYFLDASYIAVDDERVICIIDNKTGTFLWFFNAVYWYHSFRLSSYLSHVISLILYHRVRYGDVTNSTESIATYCRR